MGLPMTRPERPDYGIDAPGVVRNLFLVAGVGLLVGVAALGRLLPNPLRVPLGGVHLIIPLAHTGLAVAVGFAASGAMMLWSSKVGKFRKRERLLDLVPWTGGEQVLDVGCGRGLLLTAAARRLTEGKATGIDIWQAEDLSGNRAEATLENARREGVADRVALRTADMRQMPFADGTFDVVVSRAAIHNLYNRKDREHAIAEIARVLKPGGRAVIDDIRHLSEYAAALARHGCGDVRFVGPRWLAGVFAVFTLGSLRPGTVLARKGG